MNYYALIVTWKNIINMYVVKTEKMKTPLKIFSTEGSIEESCIEQMKAVCSLPFLHRHVALMPDGHLGFGASIGSVVATKDVVIPNLVGVDIGCGMVAVKTSLTEISTEQLKDVMGKIRKKIPVGFKRHDKTQDGALMPSSSVLPCGIVEKEKTNTRKSLGTLGGGNHFIEIQKGDDGHIWLMIHSGSRNLGLKVAKHYHDRAVKLCEKYFSDIPNKDLSFLPKGTTLYDEYLVEMNYCVEFARRNRELMMNRTLRAFRLTKGFDGLEAEERHDVAHNYARLENHFGKNVMVHRKGATSAKEGELGIIPSSQGTDSYIVEGKGNPESFDSCSHGSGRKMGRKQAERELDLKEEIDKLDRKGVIHSIRTEKDLDEASGAYKDGETVMANQTDLVDIKVRLTPLAVIKG